jgi:vancomycin aglycone glucosyltransferase
VDPRVNAAAGSRADRYTRPTAIPGMKVLLAPHGTRGDVQPLVALAFGLRARGHEPSFLAPDNFVAWIRSCGFPCEPNGVDVHAHLTSSGADLGSWRWQRHHFRRVMIPALFEAFARTRFDPDIIVGTGVQLAAPSAAEQREIPYATIAFCPCVVPNNLAPPATVRTQGYPRWINRLLWDVGTPLAAFALRGLLNDARARAGLGELDDVMSHLAGDATILAADPDLAPLGDDAPATAVTTDALVLDRAAAVDAKLDAFLDVGPPPIYVGFGSMVAKRADALASHAIDAARALGRGVVLSEGWASLGQCVEVAHDVLIVGSVPHRSLFPRIGAVVHHGGAGTTTAAAAAGAPQVVLPHVLDQFYWGHRVARLGLGPSPLPVDLVNADVLTERIDQALAEPIRGRAAAFAPVVASRNGVDDAVDHLQRLVAVH